MADTIEIQDPMQLSELRSVLKEVFDRGGDSSLSDSLSNHYLNSAEVYIVKFIGAPKCLEHGDTISVSSEDFTFPANVNNIVQIWDEANRRPLVKVDKFTWNDYITDPSVTSGSPVAWTQWGFSRRTNTESPSQNYGGLKVKFWPVPSSATTLNCDVILKPGTMIFDSDFSVLPPDYHYGLIEVALMLMGPYDIGQKAYAQHRDMAMQWLNEIRRDERRDVGGNMKLVSVENHAMRSNSNRVPLTRLDQLSGGLL